MPSKRSGLLHVETDLEAPVAGIAVCSVTGNEANARLIAAAPDLLKAAELALKQMEALAPTLSTASYLRNAIKKARGE